MKPSKLEIIGLLLAAALIFAASGCTTTTTPQGTTKQIDKEAVAQAVTLALTILNDPVVSNAVWQATQKK